MKKIIFHFLLFLISVQLFASENDEKPLLAVMDIEDKTGEFYNSVDGATEYLRNALIRSNKFFVVAESRQRAKMQELKEASYQGCYDENCQLKLGKELAADTILVTTINSLSDHYEIVSTLIDLEKGVHIKSALVTFGKNEPLQRPLKEISDQITGRKISGGEKADRNLANSDFYGVYDKLDESTREARMFWPMIIGVIPVAAGAMVMGFGSLGDDKNSCIIAGSVLLGISVPLYITGITYAVWDNYTKGERAAGFMISFGALAAAGGGTRIGLSKGDDTMLYGGIAAAAVGGGLLIGGITMAILDAKARKLKGSRPQTSFFVSPTKGGAYAQMGINF